MTVPVDPVEADFGIVSRAPILLRVFFLKTTDRRRRRSFRVGTKRSTDHYLDLDRFCAEAARKEGSWWPEWVACAARQSKEPVSDNQLYISWWNKALPQEAPVKPDAAEGGGRNAALRQRL